MVTVTFDVKTGDLEFVGSINFIAYSDRESSVSFNIKGEVLRFIIRFKHEGKEMRVDSKPIDATSAFLTFIDFKDNIGAFGGDFWHAGTIINRKLIMQYRISLMSDLFYNVELYLYLGEVVTNG